MASPKVAAPPITRRSGRLTVHHLQTRFILAGVLLVMTTVVSGLWSMWTFARLSEAAGLTLKTREQTIALISVLADALEREDDALLLAVSGDRREAEIKLRAERQRFADSYVALLQTIEQPEEKEAAAALESRATEYRTAGDALLANGTPDPMAFYYQRVNPALRRAVVDCARIRESNFRAMQLAALGVRDWARSATILVAAISAGALLVSTLVALLLARSVLAPIGELSSSVEAIRLGDFDRRVRVISADELGELAVEFNRMAEALAEFRRSNLAEVLRARDTLQSTIAALPDAVAVVDPEERIVALNPLAKSVLKATGAERASAVKDLPFPTASLAAIRAALRGQRSTETRAEFSRAFSIPLDGRRCKFMLTVVPIPDFWKGRFGAVAILYDVTDFAQLDELRMELVAVASHELKTPLTTLRMNLMMMEEKAGNLTARQQEILATAVVGCHELASTIEQLLDLTRIEAGQLRLAHDRFDLHAVIERAMMSLRPRYDDAAVSLRMVAGGQPAFVRGDAARLGMVFTNLLSNALKYTPRGGSVTISVLSTQKAGEGGAPLLHIAVTDTGKGIPEAFRQRVFEKFFRVEQQLNGAGDHSGTLGAGIGLYLCRQIIEAHGGSIACTSGENGAGACMVMDLPGARFITGELPR